MSSMAGFSIPVCCPRCSEKPCQIAALGTHKTAQIARRLVPVTTLLVWELCLGFLILMLGVPEIAYAHRPT